MTCWDMKLFDFNKKKNINNDYVLINMWKRLCAFWMCVYMCLCVHRALYYQRRWVKLDVDYLRYFDNDKVTTHTYRKIHHISHSYIHKCIETYFPTQTGTHTHTVYMHSNADTHTQSVCWMLDMDMFNSVAVAVCVCLVCCRRYIPRGSSQQPSSLMLQAWESWSLRLPQTTEHLSSGLKVKVCLFCLVISVCVYIVICHLHMSYVCTNIHVSRFIYICACIFYKLRLFIHVIALPSSWEKRLGDCTAGLHQGAPSAQHHEPWFTFDPRLSGLPGA